MTEPATAYRVLARKYRPATFAEVIGQEAMVRTLSNAIATGRIAHAFILTGVRGVGKTTTARILARALNCVGIDGTGGPTIEPCGACLHCTAIGEDRHVDVLEMDAASRTGVDDIRELTEGMRYRPVSARYKVYIIDEVHMLSKNAFNALLKTLEEPPPDVKFVFATTEIQKVPVTVLSRCQRFSLRRVPVELLAEHYRHIAEAEGVAVEPGALGLIARAADGSVRDGLSLLDQAIALSGGRVEESAVRDMLGIADRGRIFDLFEAVLKGRAADALDGMNALYQDGADPVTVLQDLLELTHFVTRLKVVPRAGTGDPIAEGDRERARPLADTVSMPVLARAWQILLKGLKEAQTAPMPAQAAEMVLVRLAYVADVPAPAELVRLLVQDRVATPTPPRGNGAGAAPVAMATPPAVSASERPSVPRPASGPAATGLATQPLDAEHPALDPVPQSFAEIVALFDKRREAVIRSQLVSQVHLVSFEPGRIEFRPAESAPRDLANRLGQLLGEWTGTRWVVAVSQAEGAPTLREQEQRREAALRSEVAGHPLVRAVLDTFPGATIAAVREHFAGTGTDAEAEAEAEDPPNMGEDFT
ncbi:MAG: DNA polymerase III subunit gamma/tau [Alphaproteobacteria bacterium]|nr:DNA polymerase III subunit gamma/tau [Alphaproteobacteria bacterium]